MRIRSTKPEFWSDEELATAVPRDGRLLYMGLWNLADEHGRLRGNPQFVKGQLFVYDDDMTPATIDRLLDVLAAVGKVVRYRVNGASFLYLPNLAKHQRLESGKVPSRLPDPALADVDESAPPEPPHPNKSARNSNQSAPRVHESARGAEKSARNRTVDGTRSEMRPDQSRQSAQTSLREPAPYPDEPAPRAEQSALLYVAGSMEHVFTPPAAGAKTRRARRGADPVVAETSARTLLAGYIDSCPERPPQRVIGQLAKEIKKLLDEGIRGEHVAGGLQRLRLRELGPSQLASVTNDVMNSTSRTSRPFDNYQDPNAYDDWGPREVGA